jgi:DNA helicase-2/ATP-dependent DNA helicase PcrA
MAPRSTLERVQAYIADGSEISPEQRTAIESTARLTIVRACPGSGKTRAFSARFAWDVATTRSPRHGVAAVSFTNVAQEEVRRRVRALEVDDGYPHFVGTIDAFLLRYVVRRFGGDVVNLSRFSHPVADRDFSVQTPSFAFGSKLFDRLSAFRIGVGASGTSHQIEHVSRDQSVTIVPAAFRDAITMAKKAAWAKGEVTHSDVVAIAWRILSKPAVAAIIAGRFPRILVDELQDTTGVRERCLRLLFQSSRFDRGFVVGDPDQCIMDFAGADPKLFDDLATITPSDTKELTFTTCHRFHERIAAVTAPLRASRVAVNGVREKTSQSGTVLLTHGFTAKPKDGSVAAVSAKFDRLCADRQIRAEHSIMLTWNEADVQRLGGLQKKHMPLKASSYSQVMGAIRAFAEGKALEAFRKTERLLAQIAFGSGRTPTNDDLAAQSLNLRAWRSIVMRALHQSACAGPAGESVEDWANRVKSAFEAAVEEIMGSHQKLGARFRKDIEGTKKLLNTTAEQYLPDPQSDAMARVSNIHQVKGQEFQAVCVYVPADRKGNEPADVILKDGLAATADILSARRVLYVGATRAQDLLVMTVPRRWIATLQEYPYGQSFLAAFDEVIDLA